MDADQAQCSASGIPSLSKNRGEIEYAGMAELADALDLGSSGVIRVGSTPTTRTNFLIIIWK